MFIKLIFFREFQFLNVVGLYNNSCTAIFWYRIPPIMVIYVIEVLLSNIDRSTESVANKYTNTDGAWKSH